mgnify:CR=1 FL=1
MTIKSSDAADPTLSFEKDIEAEFGQGRGRRRIGAYYGFNEYGDMKLPLDEGIPTSGGISFRDFYGKRLNMIVDVFSGSSTVYQIDASKDCPKKNVGTRLVKDVKNYIDDANTAGDTKKVIIHINKRIGSCTYDEGKSVWQTAFRTGEWKGLSPSTLKIYIGQSGVIAGAGGRGGKGGVYAWYGGGGKYGNSALGIDYIYTQVTVMADGHPNRISDGTPGAILAGCGGGGGGGGASYHEIVVEEFEHTVNAGTGLLPNFVTTTYKVGKLKRWWSGGGGGGGGRGIPKGDTISPPFDLSNNYGGPTGYIKPPGSSWSADGVYSGTRAQSGEDPLILFYGHVLHQGADGGNPGYPGGNYGNSLAVGGEGGAGGDYTSGTSGTNGSFGNSSQEYGGFLPSDIAPENQHYPKSLPRSKSGGPGGSSGYSVIGDGSGFSWGPNHDSGRVIGETISGGSDMKIIQTGRR